MSVWKRCHDPSQIGLFFKQKIYKDLLKIIYGVVDQDSFIPEADSGQRIRSGFSGRFDELDLFTCFVDRLYETFKRKRLYQIIHCIYFKSLHSKLRKCSGKNDLRRLLRGSGHIDVRKNNVHRISVKIFDGIKIEILLVPRRKQMDGEIGRYAVFENLQPVC